MTYDFLPSDRTREQCYFAGAEDAMMRRLVLTFSLVVFASAALADSPVKVEDELGILNPEDTGVEMLKRKIEMGVIDSVTCSLGINATKADKLELARKLTRRCAEAGYTKAMTWMSQLENNGMGGDYNPDAAADWDRRAAEAGDPVGRFNYGLDLMRGHGVTKDEALGRRYIDQAAEDGLAIAKRLQGAGYDLDEVTPDADNWRYAPVF
ncbi:MAG: sel1 repeat family protein [Pseudomonadota bacterium]